MRLFEHFPQNDKTKCPICGTNDDKPCFLMPIQGTENGNVCEAAPTHTECIAMRVNEFIYNRDVGVIYMRVP